MSDDRPDKPGDDLPENAEGANEPGGDSNIASGPAPWEHAESREAPDVDEGSEGEATYLADDRMSLDSKLRGGGRDLGGDDPGEHTRLCPACGRVTSFIDDTCTNCKHKLGTGGYEDIQQLQGLATGQSELPVTRILLIALIGIIVVVILVIALPRLFNRSGGETTATPAPQQQNTATSTSGTYAGQLDEVTVDDTFRDMLVEAVKSGNAGWERAGLDAYVYRINLYSEVEPAQYQRIRVNAYVGGADHVEAMSGTGDVPFRTGMAPFTEDVTSHAGVEFAVVLEYTGGEEIPARDDIYLRYGYYYGMEHMHELESIVKALETEKINNGEYPAALTGGMLPANLNSRGGLLFMAGGVGYLPIFKTDSNGNIVMGTGSGLDSFLPEECTGYYLVKFTTKEGIGVDLYSDEELEYYIEHISRFPYDPPGPIRNMILAPDGTPDGIACVFKNGVLQED